MGRVVARTLNGRPAPPRATTRVRPYEWVGPVAASLRRPPGLLVGASDLLRIRAPRQISLPSRFSAFGLNP